MIPEQLHSKSCACNQCLAHKPLDEMVSLESGKVTCIDCETNNFSDKYENYVFDIQPVNQAVPRSKIKKLMEWCLG